MTQRCPGAVVFLFCFGFGGIVFEIRAWSLLCRHSTSPSYLFLNEGQKQKMKPIIGKLI
jgi:hypothetical protein